MNTAMVVAAAMAMVLHEKAGMAGAGLPEPIKRPGIGILAVEGKEFEMARNDQLVRLLGAIVQFSKRAAQYGNWTWSQY